jgi:integrase
LASDVEWFVGLRSTYAKSTWLNRKSYLKACISWAIEEGLYIGKNPYSKLKGIREVHVDVAKPFTVDEIRLIINAFDSNQFCPKASAFKHSHYSAFIRFLFITGCRLGEAIGLTWDCIDFENRVLAIKQALGRDLASGANNTRKIIKPTKTGRSHHIPMNEELYLLLSKHCSPKEGFVFPGYKGKYIDIKGFSRRVWKPILAGLSIEYRSPYQTRHTCLSYVAKEHGLAAAAALAGHKDLTMTTKHYVRFTGNLRDALPTLDT